MRVLVLTVLICVGCVAAGVHLRPRLPQVSLVLFTIAVLLGALGLGAFFGLT